MTARPTKTAFDLLHPVVQHHVVNTLQWPSLRPLQAEAVQPVMDGVDCLLLAPTAGGKTEAAVLPLLSRMAAEGWTGTSVLYVCPLRALLNNLQPRIDAYAAWLGRSARYWHGDVDQAQRRDIQVQRPDFLLTTPESLEAMLLSRKVDREQFFFDVRVVVVDEVHAFAGDDRGWHLLHVLERIAEIAARPLQRIGLSATVGNAEELLGWLQGAPSHRPRRVVAPPSPAPGDDVTVDYVGSVEGAATVIGALHRGEKRLVFVDSRRRAEELGAALRAREIETYLSHSSLSAAERSRSERAFAEARDCVIVSTSTLELGIDVGDLDRVIQIGAPATVASFLQRLGRTGRRSGTTRNCLFLALDHDQLLHTVGLLMAWRRGWVEPVVAPAAPRHIVAQQLLALALQEQTVGLATWPRWWHGLSPMAADGRKILTYLVERGFLDIDSGLAFIGPEAERRFGRRHFSDLMAVFTGAPEFTVLAGRDEIGSVGDDVLLADPDGAPRVLLLAGRGWKVTHIDWKRRRCQVEPTDLPGRATWSGRPGGLSFTLTRAMRDVLLGTNPTGITLSRRATGALTTVRGMRADHVDPGGIVLRRGSNGDVHWWTWAGSAANRTLLASLNIADHRQRIGDQVLRLRHGIDLHEAHDIMSRYRPEDLVRPHSDPAALRGLKFSAALPEAMASESVGRRLGDERGATAALGDRRVLTIDT